MNEQELRLLAVAPIITDRDYDDVEHATDALEDLGARDTAHPLHAIYRSLIDRLTAFALRRSRARKQAQRRSDLDSSGFTSTQTEAFQWASAVVKRARLICRGQIYANVWGYRDPVQAYAIDLFPDEGEAYTVTLQVSDTTSFFHSIFGAEATVFDAVEALHLIGIIARGADAVIDVGRWKNETNTAVLAKVRGRGHTNGAMAKAGS